MYCLFERHPLLPGSESPPAPVNPDLRIAWPRWAGQIHHSQFSTQSAGTQQQWPGKGTVPALHPQGPPCSSAQTDQLSVPLSAFSHTFPKISFLCPFSVSWQCLQCFSMLLLHLLLILYTLQCFPPLPPSTPHFPSCHSALPDSSYPCYCQLCKYFSQRTFKIHTALLKKLISLFIRIFFWHIYLSFWGAMFNQCQVTAMIKKILPS